MKLLLLFFLFSVISALTIASSGRQSTSNHEEATKSYPRLRRGGETTVEDFDKAERVAAFLTNVVSSEPKKESEILSYYYENGNNTFSSWRSLRFVDGSNNSGENSSSRITMPPSINNNMNSLIKDAMQEFKLRHRLKVDADLEMQIISTEKNYVVVDGNEFSLNDLEPLDSFAPNATHFIDGKPVQEYEIILKPLTFVGGNKNSKIIVTKNQNGDISSIRITATSIDQSTSLLQHYHLIAIVPGIVFTTIRPQDRDPKKALKPQIQNYDNNNNNWRVYHNENKSMNYDNYSVQESGNRRFLQTCSSYKVVEVAIAYDSTACNLLGYGQSNDALTAIKSIVSLTSSIYESQGVCIKVVLVHTDGYCNANNDPFADARALKNVGCTGNRGAVQWLDEWLQANKANVARDSFHLFMNDLTFPGSTYGCACQDCLCSSTGSGGHGVENFAFEGVEMDRWAAIFAHELGHNFGLTHVSSNTETWVMDFTGFGTHYFSPNSLSILEQNVPGYTCLSDEVTTTPAPSTSPPTTQPPTTQPPTTQPPETQPPTNQPPTTQPPETQPPTTQPPETQPPTTQPPTTPAPTTPSTTLAPTTPSTTPAPTSASSTSSPITFRSIATPVFGLCLNIRAYVTTGNPIVRLWTCTGNDNQMFYMDDDGFIRSKLDTNKCLSRYPNNPAVTALRLYDCNPIELLTSQQWTWENGRIKSTAEPNKCIQWGSNKGRPARINTCENGNVQFYWAWN